MRVLALVCALAGLDALVLAQKSPKAAPAPKPQQMIFGVGDDIEADVPTAGGDLITGTPHAVHVSLITVRATFFPEMLKSAEDR